MYRQVDEGDGQVVLQREQQPQGPGDGAARERGAVGAGAGPARGQELVPERHVVARGPRWLVGPVGSLAASTSHQAGNTSSSGPISTSRTSVRGTPLFTGRRNSSSASGAAES